MANKRKKVNIKSRQGKLNYKEFNLNDNENVDHHFNEAILRQPGSPNISEKPETPHAPEKQKSLNSNDLKGVLLKKQLFSARPRCDGLANYIMFTLNGVVIKDEEGSLH